MRLASKKNVTFFVLIVNNKMRSNTRSRRSKLYGGRRTAAEKLSKPNKCEGETDLASGNPILAEYAIRLKENGHFFCFDIRDLKTWFENPTSRNKNPYTGIKFSNQNLSKIERKIEKVLSPPGHAGASHTYKCRAEIGTDRFRALTAVAQYNAAHPAHPIILTHLVFNNGNDGPEGPPNTLEFRTNYSPITNLIRLWIDSPDDLHKMGQTLQRIGQYNGLVVNA